jgi:replication-associated recombination protein RarA
MTMKRPNQLVSELLRPQQLDDLTLPLRVIHRLQRMVDSGTIMNMLFYGKPGLGKTSAARVITEAIGADVCEINGSALNGVDTVRSTVERYASSVSLYRKPKICFIDEADYLSKGAQAAFRHLIERSSNNCRFLFALNDISRVVPAIRSRLMPICFDIAPADRAEVQANLTARYERKLSELGIKFDEERLNEIIGIFYPDLRSIANHLEFEFA